jgi:hypothetical protein
MPGINGFARTLCEMCPLAGWRMTGLGGALNRGDGAVRGPGERMTMVPAAAAAHSAPGAAFLALPHPLLLILALSAGVRP